jgi:hypothetical protein
MMAVQVFSMNVLLVRIVRIGTKRATSINGLLFNDTWSGDKHRRGIERKQRTWVVLGSSDILVSSGFL